MTKEEIADELRDIEMGIGALIAVISECEIKIPEDHPDPTAIPDCINLGKDAHASIKRLQMYWDGKGINPESVGALRDIAVEFLDIMNNRLNSVSQVERFVALSNKAEKTLSASKLTGI
jgi:hypothetical protein